MAEEVQLTSFCQPAPADGQILIPIDAPDVGKSHVYVTAGSAKAILKAGRRADNGAGACVGPGILAQFGGGTPSVSYRGIGTVERVWRDRWLLLQLGIAVLTVIGTILTTMSAYFRNTSATATAWDGKTAVFVLAFAAAGAVAKFIKELRDL